MTKELYIYASPKISEKDSRSFNIIPILCVTLFSSFVAIFGNIAFGIVVTALYLGLSLLAFIDKDFKSKYMKLVVFCVVDVSIVCIYFFSKIFSVRRLALSSIILGVVFFAIYEIVVFTRIEKSYYSQSSNNKKPNYIVSTTAVFLFTLIFKLLSKNPRYQSLLASFIIILCSVLVLSVLISIQKLVLYLITRNKIAEI